jgi:hypothetical protein
MVRFIGFADANAELKNQFKLVHCVVANQQGAAAFRGLDTGNPSLQLVALGTA